MKQINADKTDDKIFLLCKKFLSVYDQHRRIQYTMVTSIEYRLTINDLRFMKFNSIKQRQLTISNEPKSMNNYQLTMINALPHQKEWKTENNMKNRTRMIG